MVTICQLCGDKGFSNALIYCDKCSAYSIHQYCLDVLPNTFNGHVAWFCVDCEPTKPTLDKSKDFTPGKSIFGSPGVQVREESAKKLKKNGKKKLKKKVKGESECLNKSIANSDLSISQGGPPINHLIGAHFRDTCKDTKGEMKMDLYQEDRANSVENTSYVLDHDQSSVQPLVDPVERKRLHIRDKKIKKKLKKKVKDQSERVNKSLAYVELSKIQGSPPNNHLVETHLRDTCECTKGQRHMELYQEDKVFSFENTSYFLDDGQSSAQPLLDPVQSLCVRDKNAKKNLKRVEDESDGVNKSIANSDLLISQGILQNNHLMEGRLEDTSKGTKGEMQMELYQRDRAISVENTSYILDHGHFSAEPLVDPVWRGSLRLTDKKFGTIRLAAHLSSLACSEAEKEAKLLQMVISAELLPRHNVWPKGFAKWGPDDESIAMYFFPVKRQENLFDLLIETMISQDLAIITEVKDADLLVFTSLSLPVQYHRVFSKLYLWGVFRGKKSSNIRKVVNFSNGRDTGKMFSPYRQSPASPLSGYGLRQAIDTAWGQALDAEEVKM